MSRNPFRNSGEFPKKDNHRAGWREIGRVVCSESGKLLYGVSTLGFGEQRGKTIATWYISENERERSLLCSLCEEEIFKDFGHMSGAVVNFALAHLKFHHEDFYTMIVLAGQNDLSEMKRYETFYTRGRANKNYEGRGI